MKKSEKPRYLEPSQVAGRAFVSHQLKGSVVMLNLLRFRDVADYSATPDLAPPTPITGQEAYQRYVTHTWPFLQQAGGDLIFVGTGGQFLIGPPDERWDLTMLIRHASVDAFLSFASNEDYLAGIGHRMAALEDSRLLPLVE